jgi:hypothetical protein
LDSQYLLSFFVLGGHFDNPPIVNLVMFGSPPRKPCVGEGLKNRYGLENRSSLV